MERSWPTPPSQDPQSLYLWALEMVKLLRSGEIGTSGGESIVAGGAATPGNTRALTDTATVAWDFATDNQAKANVPDDAITYAKMQNISATSRILGRATSGAGNTEELTLSQVLDFIGSAAQGDILYRDSSAWARLGAGTNRQFLQTQGAAANPQWTNGGTVLLTSGTVSAVATLDIVLTAYTAYRGLIFELSGFLPATDGVDLLLQFSTNGGSSYDGGAGNYDWAARREGDGAAGANAGSGADTVIHLVGVAEIGNASTEGINVTVKILNQTSTAFWTKAEWKGHYISNAATPGGNEIHGGGAREAAQDTDAVRFQFSSGNIAAGNYAVYGLL
jgi:hypothetical protein